MKSLFLIVLSTIIIFFVWNILKRIFYTSFYENIPSRKTTVSQEKNTKLPENVQWDAETVEFEEIKEDPKDK